jgi:predicted nucleotidyltransferase
MIFEGTVSWKILSAFFSSPSKSYYVQEIAREVRISPGSASYASSALEKEGILKKEKKANSLFYSLDNSSPLVRKMKSAWFLEQLMKFRECWENPEFQSVALYGSRASGDFIEASDTDILVISNLPRQKALDSFAPMERHFMEKLSITILPIAKWVEMAKKGGPFYKEVLSNHIILYGTPLVLG